MMAFLFLVSIAWSLLAPPGSGLLDNAAAFSYTLVPIAVGIAILRYRLYEIDVLIKRSLVYAPLTVMLDLFYLGGVVVLQYGFRALSEQESQLASVASTLTLAALFNPLRRRVQGLVDRRFYRRKYDARSLLDQTARRDRPGEARRAPGGGGRGSYAASTRLAVVAPRTKSKCKACS